MSSSWQSRSAAGCFPCCHAARSCIRVPRCFCLKEFLPKTDASQLEDLGKAITTAMRHMITVTVRQRSLQRQRMRAQHPAVMQVREFQPKMVAIRDASKLEELKEAIRDVPTQPEILVGDEGAIEVARHSDVDAVVTGIVGMCSVA